MSGKSKKFLLNFNVHFSLINNTFYLDEISSKKFF